MVGKCLGGLAVFWCFALPRNWFHNLSHPVGGGTAIWKANNALVGRISMFCCVSFNFIILASYPVGGNITTCYPDSVGGVWWVNAILEIGKLPSIIRGNYIAGDIKRRVVSLLKGSSLIWSGAHFRANRSTRVTDPSSHFLTRWLIIVRGAT